MHSGIRKRAAVASRPAKGTLRRGLAAVGRVLQENEGRVELHVQSFSNKVTLATAPLPTAKTRQKEKAQQPSETPNSEKTLQMQFTRPGIYASGAAAARVGTASVVVDTASLLSAGPGASELTVASAFGSPLRDRMALSSYRFTGWLVRLTGCCRCGLSRLCGRSRSCCGPEAPGALSVCLLFLLQARHWWRRPQRWIRECFLNPCRHTRERDLGVILSEIPKRVRWIVRVRSWL